MMRAVSLATLATLGALAGCPGPIGNDGSCETDSDCSGGDVCANIHSCYPSDQVHAVSVKWTVDGQPASDALCGTSPQLDLTIVDPSGEETATYEPVPCAAGGFPFSRLPTLYNAIELSSESDGVSGSADIPSGGGEVDIDLELGAAVDGGSAP